MKKILTFLLCGAMMTTGITPQASAQQAAMPPADLASIHLPESLATVEARFVGQDPRFLLIVQDVHANYGAQKNFVQVMESLEIGPTAEQFRLLALEGASSQVDTAFFKAAKNKEMRDSICDEFMRKGYLSGADFYLIRAQGKAKGVGVEDLALYKENLALFRKCYELRPKVELFLAALQRGISDKQARLWPKEMRQWNDRQRRFEAGNMKFTEYCRALGAGMAESGMDLASYANLHKAIRLAQAEDQYDAKLVQEEKRNLVEKLQEFGTSKEKQKALETVLLFKLGKISSAQFYAFLLEQAAKNGIEAGPNLRGYAEAAKLMAELNVGEVQRESRDVLQALKEKSFTAQEQKDLDGLDQYAQTLERLMNLSLTRAEWERYQALKAQWPGQRMAVFLKDVSRDDFLSDLPEKFEPIEEFYHVAERRDKVLLDNTLAAMDKEKSNTAVLIVGGFHGKGIAEALKRQGISHVIATCRVDAKQKDDVYLQRMLNKGENIQVAKKSGNDLQVPDLLGNENDTEVQAALAQLKAEFTKAQKLEELKYFLSHAYEGPKQLALVVQSLKGLDAQEAQEAIDLLLDHMTLSAERLQHEKIKVPESALIALFGALSEHQDKAIAKQATRLKALLEAPVQNAKHPEQATGHQIFIPPWIWNQGYVQESKVPNQQEQYVYFEFAGPDGPLRLFTAEYVRHYMNQPLTILSGYSDMASYKETPQDKQAFWTEKRKANTAANLRRLLDFISYLETFENQGHSHVLISDANKGMLRKLREQIGRAAISLEAGRTDLLEKELAMLFTDHGIVSGLKTGLEPVSMQSALAHWSRGEPAVPSAQAVPDALLQQMVDGLLQGPFEGTEQITPDDLQSVYVEHLKSHAGALQRLIGATLRKMSPDGMLPDLRNARMQVQYKGAGRFKRVSAVSIAAADGGTFDFAFVMGNLKEQEAHRRAGLDDKVKNEQWVMKQAIHNYEESDKAMREADAEHGLVLAADAANGMMTLELENGERLPQDIGSFEPMFEAYLKFFKEHGIAVFDMKPENVVVENGIPRVADFDSASERGEFTDPAGYLAQLIIGVALTSKSPTPSPSDEISRFFPSRWVVRALLSQDEEGATALRALWNAMNRVYGSAEIEKTLDMLVEIGAGLKADRQRVLYLAEALENAGMRERALLPLQVRIAGMTPEQRQKALTPTFVPGVDMPLELLNISSAASSAPAQIPASGQAGWRGMDTERPKTFVTRDALQAVPAKELLGRQGGVDALVSWLSERDRKTGLMEKVAAKISDDGQALEWTYALKGKPERTVRIDLFRATREQNNDNHATILPDEPGVAASERRAVALSEDLFSLPPEELRAHLAHEIAEIMGLPHPYGVLIGSDIAMRTSVRRALRMLKEAPENRLGKWAQTLRDYGKPEWQADPDRRQNDKVMLQAALGVDEPAAEGMMKAIDAERAALAKAVTDMLHEEAKAIAISGGEGSGSQSFDQALDTWINAQIKKDAESATFANMAASLVAAKARTALQRVQQENDVLRALSSHAAADMTDAGLLLDSDVLLEMQNGEPVFRSHAQGHEAFYRDLASRGLLSIALKDASLSAAQIQKIADMLGMDVSMILTAEEISAAKQEQNALSMAQAAHALARARMSEKAKTALAKISVVLAQENQDFWELAAAKEFLYGLMNTKTGSILLSGNMIHAASSLDPGLRVALQEALGQGNNIQVLEETHPDVDAAIKMLRSVRTKA